MAKVLRSNVKHDGEVIPAGTRMSSKVFPAKLKKRLKERGFFVEEASDTEDEAEDAEAPEEEAAEEEAQEAQDEEG